MLQLPTPRAAFAIGALLLAAPPGWAGEVWHATRTLQAGDMLRADDIESALPQTQRVRPGLVDSERHIVGLEVKRRIVAGQPITDRDIGQRDLVRAGQPVRVFWQSAGMTLELQAKALEGGAQGSEIRVHNPQSGRTLRATVISDGTAEVRTE